MVAGDALRTDPSDITVTSNDSEVVSRNQLIHYLQFLAEDARVQDRQSCELSLRAVTAMIAYLTA